MRERVCRALPPTSALVRDCRGAHRSCGRSASAPAAGPDLASRRESATGPSLSADHTPANHALSDSAGGDLPDHKLSPAASVSRADQSAVRISAGLLCGRREQAWWSALPRTVYRYRACMLSGTNHIKVIECVTQDTVKAAHVHPRAPPPHPALSFPSSSGPRSCLPPSNADTALELVAAPQACEGAPAPFPLDGPQWQGRCAWAPRLPPARRGTARRPAALPSCGRRRRRRRAPARQNKRGARARVEVGWSGGRPGGAERGLAGAS
jgi:hypothetical protein